MRTPSSDETLRCNEFPEVRSAMCKLDAELCLYEGKKKLENCC